MSFITDIFSGGAQGILDGASKIVGEVVKDPNESAALTEKLKELVIQSQNSQAQLAEAKYEAQLKDIDSARQMQIAALKQTSWFAKNIIHILAAFVTLGFFGLLAYMCKFDIPAANKDMLNIMLGSLGTAWVSIVGFYYGSSKSDSDKNETIKNLSV